MLYCSTRFKAPPTHPEFLINLRASNQISSPTFLIRIRYLSITKHLRRGDNGNDKHQNKQQTEIKVARGGLRTCKERRIEAYVYFNRNKIPNPREEKVK